MHKMKAWIDYISLVNCLDFGLMVQSYYNVYGGATAQYPMYGTGHGGLMNGSAAAFYPYLQFGEGSGGAATSYPTSGQSYGVQYPYNLFQYSAINSTTGGYPQHYGAPMSLAPTAALPSGLPSLRLLLIFMAFTASANFRLCKTRTENLIRSPIYIYSIISSSA